MTNALAPNFQTTLTDCDVLVAFQNWLAQHTMTDRARFLLGAPNGVDADLISLCGIHLGLSEKIAIRMAFNLCNQAAKDENEARTAAKLSPESADIPLEDRSTLKTLFERRHGFMVSSKRLLNDELVKKTFHQFNTNPKALKFLPARAAPPANVLGRGNWDIAQHHWG